ncbi:MULTISPECIES: TerB family tellurite resistance protein [unclassified Sphingobacterium]|uniref:TerB family tellurite resistance protein n=1 Tax=unclassified Sphingobacterium TaxID=2609468 RepID=UPI0020C34E71|nr:MULTISPECIES: TerB family tellurite resistance protein [unclassified Sphingobacterium]
MKAIKPIIFAFLMISVQALPARSQSAEVVQLLLNVEKLAQFKTILKQMKQGYNILQGGYRNVKDLSAGNFNLHKTFLDALLRVSPTVRRYHKVADIIQMQLNILETCHTFNRQLNKKKLFQGGELSYLLKIYQGLLDRSLNNLEELVLVLSDRVLSMNDSERLHAIDGIYDEMQEMTIFLRKFSNDSKLLLLQRKKEVNDVRSIRKQIEQP